jgi:GYF domain 2
MYKIIGADQKEYGPVTADQLRHWLAEGRVNPQTQVLPEGATEWTTLGALPEFATASSAAPPTLPSFPAPASAAAALVAGPAIGLIVTAILGGLVQMVSLIRLLLVHNSMPVNSQMPGQAWVAMLSGPIGVVMSIIAILMSVVILLGALKMKKLESYGLAMTASILAMIPCLSPCCVIGLPIGIWALVVLSKPEVKSAFH